MSKHATQTKSAAETDDDDDFGPVPTFEFVIEERNKRLKELRKGNKGQRRLAAALKGCRKGKRCTLLQCPVCERLKLIDRKGIPASIIKSVGSPFERISIDVTDIEIVKRRRPLNEKKVRALATSINEIGLQSPITVARHKKKIVLVSGWHRLEAVQRLSWDAIPCVVLTHFAKEDERLWQVAENYYRAELTALERAEYTEELRILLEAKRQVGQLAPPGGRQPKNSGINNAAKMLGVSREVVRRSKNIAAIAASVKKRARELGLDKVQRALLQIARAATEKEQALALEKIVEKKRKEASESDDELKDVAVTQEIRALQNEIHDHAAALAQRRKRLRLVMDKAAIKGVPVQLPMEEPLLGGDVVEVASPPMAPDQKPGSRPADVGNGTLKNLMAAWHAAPPEDQDQFCELVGLTQKAR